jgi:hypothetical protein
MTTNRSSLVKPLALLGVLVLALFFFAVWRPRAAQVSDIRHDRDTQQQELATLQAAAAAKPTGDDPATKALAAAIPPQPELAQLLRQLQTIATETGTDQKTVSPAAPVASSAGGSSVQLVISTSGPRAGVYGYLHRLGALERLLVVDKVSISVPPADPALPGADLLNADITARVFTTAASAVPAS